MLCNKSLKLQQKLLSRGLETIYTINTKKQALWRPRWLQTCLSIYYNISDIQHSAVYVAGGE